MVFTPILQSLPQRRCPEPGFPCAVPTYGNARVEISDGLSFLPRVKHSERFLLCVPATISHEPLLARPFWSSLINYLRLFLLARLVPLVTSQLWYPTYSAERPHGSPRVTRKPSFTTSDLKSLSRPRRDIKLKFQSAWQETSSPGHDMLLESQVFFLLPLLPSPRSLLGTNHNHMIQNRQLGPCGSEAQGVCFFEWRWSAHTASFCVSVCFVRIKCTLYEGSSTFLPRPKALTQTLCSPFRNAPGLGPAEGWNYSRGDFPPAHTPWSQQ